MARGAIKAMVPGGIKDESMDLCEGVETKRIKEGGREEEKMDFRHTARIEPEREKIVESRPFGQGLLPGLGEMQSRVSIT